MGVQLNIAKMLLVLAVASSTLCQDLPVTYNARSVPKAEEGVCPATEDLRERIMQDIRTLISNNVVPALTSQNQTQTGNSGPGYGACGCGGPGWRRVAYLNMSDPTQTCPPAWELITTPRRSCGRPSSALSQTCQSAMFHTQSISYSQVCGRLIGYQFGEPQAFILENNGFPQTIEGSYVDGLSLTYGSPRQHIWTFAVGLDEGSGVSGCPCDTQGTVVVPSYVGSDYFCETGVPSGQSWSSTFYADDPLWDGQGCGPTSTCCTFNNPPWFCKQLPQSTTADLEMRLCSAYVGTAENTPIELIEIYAK